MVVSALEYEEGAGGRNGKQRPDGGAFRAHAQWLALFPNYRISNTELPCNADYAPRCTT